MKTVLEFILNILAAHRGAVVTIFAIMSAFWAFVLGAIQTAQELITEFDELLFPVEAGDAFNVSPFAAVNYVIPLDWALILFVAFVPFYLLCVAIRLVKSWIPFIS